MKIVIINGSPRRNGTTAKVLKKLKNSLEEKNDVTVFYVNLADRSISSCIGCVNCYTKGECPIKDDMKEINENVANSDCLIIGSPVYVSNVPGILKTYIDRGHFVLEQSLIGKYTYSVCTYEIAGADSVIRILNNLFRISGGVLLGSYKLKLLSTSNPLENPSVNIELNRISDKLYKNISKNKKRRALFDKLYNYIALHLVIKRHVLKHREKYGCIIQRWKSIKVISSS